MPKKHHSHDQSRSASIPDKAPKNANTRDTVDFKKKKVKVGKKAPPPSNATNTSFKTKGINHSQFCTFYCFVINPINSTPYDGATF
jgi:hypothetical protein